MVELCPVKENLESLRNRIAQAAVAAGRTADAVTLIAVSKTHGPEAVAAALAAGQAVFGENRVQEAATKFPRAGARLHLIGALQTNKVTEAVALADCIEVLDRDRLLDALDKAAQKVGKLPDLLVQVNIGDEPQKAGVSTGQADTFIRLARSRFGTKLTGLMCIPPAEGDPASYFQRLSAMADAHGLQMRSMGMSGDFEIAIAFGATHVRLGTAVFGTRAALPEKFL